jgi:membrane-bound lytic murein transglycosylase D
MMKISWWLGILLLCALLAGCGGGRKVAVKPPPVPPTDFTVKEVMADQEESLAEQLSENRVEELLAKSGLHREDPALEEELKKWDQTLKIDVPVARNKQVKAYLVYFTTERKNTIRKYLSRSSRYLPMIRGVFQEYGLPEDLAYLAMIESGFNPHAYSHAHACGMWQFIRGTGRRYGLAIDNYVDERRDPVKSTHAAAQYLLDLYKQFGSWYLAAASYNCGEGRVQREIDGSTLKNFWELSANQCLPGETKNYVPQMIAATIIAKNPKKFGFKNIPYLPPLPYDTVKVDEPTSLRAAAIACNVPLEEFELLNPELRRGVTPPDQSPYVMKIPKASQKLFARHIQMARVEAPARASASVHTARKSSRSKYTRKKSHSRKSARSSRSKKASSRRVASSKKRSHKTTRSSKGKASRNKGSVQVASVLAGGGKSSKASTSTSKKRSKRSAKKSRSRSSKKKVSSRKSSQRLAAARGKTSRSQGKRSSRMARSN